MTRSLAGHSARHEVGMERILRRLALLAMVVMAACNQVRGEVPDTSKFSYPTQLVADPAGDTVYVVSTNFDSRWQYGWVTPIDATDLTILGASGVEVGSFAGDPVFELNDGKPTRMILPIRDGSTLAVIDLSRDQNGKAVLSCGAVLSDGRRRCGSDRSIKLEGLAKNADGDSVDTRDPFAIAIGAPITVPADGDRPAGIERPLYVGSLQDGVILVFSIRDGEMPVYQDYQVFDAGLHTMIELKLSDTQRVLLASNRGKSELHVMAAGYQNGKWKALAQDPIVVAQSAASGDYFRGMVLSAHATVLYAAFRSPPSLAIFDVPADGRPVLRTFVALAGLPSGVAVYAPTGGTELVYVTDFAGDSLYVVDPAIPAVVDRIPVGQGPYGVAIAAERAFVADFEEQKVSVVALNPDDPEYHKEIKRLP